MIAATDAAPPSSPTPDCHPASYQRGSPGSASSSSSPNIGIERGSSNNRRSRRMIPLSIDPNSRQSSFAYPSSRNASCTQSADDWLDPSISMPRLDDDYHRPPPAPKLSHDRLRFLFGLMGTGTLFPYNAIITCVDYYSALHPAVGDVAGQLASCITALLVTTLLLLPLSAPPPPPPPAAKGASDGECADGFEDEPTATATATTGSSPNRNHARSSGGPWCRSLSSILASATPRIIVGYALCLVCLLLMAGLRSPSMATLNVASFIVGVADATSQSGLYVFAASFHEPSYSAAVTFGSAIAGLAVGVMRLATRGLFDTTTVEGLRAGVAVLFVLSAGVIAACIWALAVVFRDGGPTLDVWDGGRGATAVDDLQNENNVQMTEMRGGIMNSAIVSTDGNGCDGDAVNVMPSLRNDKCCYRLLHHPRFEVYLQTMRITWKPTFSAFLNFFITLSLFPGTVSSIQSPSDNGGGWAIRFGDWLPIILITTFNAADCAGRGVLNIERLGIARLLLLRRDAVRSNRDGGDDRALLPNLDVLIWYHSLARVAFYPLLAICILPVAPHPIVSSDLLRCVLVFVFGFSNGFVNCAAFMASPTMVCDERQRSAASLLLLLAIYFGLTGGAYFGLVVDSVLKSIQKA